MSDAFYGAFSPARFALLGLWLAGVQIRMAIALYVVVGVLAFFGGVDLLRTEAVLLT